MQRILLLLLLQPVVTLAQGQLVEIQGGYIPHVKTSSPFFSAGNYLVYDANNGYYLGAGVIIPGDGEVGFKISAVYDRLNLSGPTTIAGPLANQKSAGFFALTPAVSVMPELGNFSLMLTGGFPVKFPLQKGYRRSVAAEFRVGIGFKGVMITGSYELGITRFIYETIGSNDVPMKISMAKVGISLMPQLWFKEKSPYR